MTSDNRKRLEQGGITLLPDDISVPLTAAVYTHASLSGRTIVRLVPEPLLAAEDLTLGVSGLTPKGRSPVGHTRRRAIGFPAWPILNDPPNAQHALNLVADLERAAQLARRKPGRAKDLIVSLTETLDASAPHFLPTFLEEAARIFLGVDNTKLAAQMYTRAREAERRHALLVDEERHREAVMEFAFTGAISTKELSAEAKNLSERLSATEAYETFRALCVERVRGGLTPYAAMKRDLAKLAKAAGLKPAEEEAKVAAALLRAGSIERADDKFWKNYKTAIRKAAKQDESLRAHLLTLAPEELVIDDWLQLLLDTGAVELVKDGTRPEFVQHIVDFGSRTSWRNGTAEKLAPLLAGILPDAGCTSVALRTIHGAPAAALEQLLAHGVALELPEDTSRESVAIEDWAGSENRIPLAHLVADDDFRDFVYQGIVNVLGNADLTAVVATDPHLHPLVIELITEQVERLEAAPPSTDRLLEVTQFARHFEFVDDAEVQALLARVRTYHGDLAEVLAETLRRGMLDELGWHQCESAYTDLQNTDPDAHVALCECWPGIILHNYKQGIHLVGDTRTEIQNWHGDRLASVLEADGHYGIVHYGPPSYEDRVSWSDAQESLPDEFHPDQIGDMAATVPVPGGRLIGKGVVIRPGQPTWGPGSEHFFVEDDRIWLVTGDTADEATVAEINPGTGRKGRTSLPHWFVEHSRRHPDLVFDPTRSQLRPVSPETADSPLSTAGGYHRHAVFTRPGDPDFCLIVDADGTEYTVTGGFASRVCGVIRVPHGEPRLLARDRFRTFLLDPSDDMPTLHHGSQFETVMWWHHTSSRDPEASARFRKIAADELRPLIEHFAESGIDDVSDDVEDELSAKVTELLGVQDTAVRDAVVKHAHSLVKAWPEWDTSVPSNALAEAPLMQKHRDVLAPVVGRTWPKFEGLDVWRGAASLGLHERDVPQDTSRSRGNEAKDWVALLGHGDALLALAATAGRTAEEVRGLKEYWVVLRETGVLEASHLFVDVLEVPQALGTYSIDFPPGIVTAEEGFGWQRYVVRGGGGGPITIDGHTLKLVDRLQVHSSRTDLEPVFNALIERIETDGPRPWSPEPGEAFAAATGVPLTDAHLVMAGFPGFNNFNENFLPTNLRKAMGMKVAEASAAKARMGSFRRGFARVLAAGVPEDTETLLDRGLDIDAMATYWSEHGPKPVPQLPEEIAARKPKTLEEQPLMRVLAGEHAEDGWGGEVAALLWLANELDMSDPQRASLADYAEELDQSPAGLGDVSLGASYYTYVVGEKLGLSSSQWADLSEQFEKARFRSRRRYADEPVFADLSDITDPDDLDLRVAQLWSAASEGDTQTTAAVGLRLCGALSAYTQWLREPGEGSPRDPLAVVPELVAEVAATLNVSEDAARYYLQLLAWADPTDANVRRWNGWKKPDITRAGTQLVEAGVVVEAKRPRAGRGFFLQGAWSDSESPHPPVETWKVDAFSMTTPAARSKLRPMLEVTVAPEPPTTWFATCWKRSQGDDAPRFAELETTRRSRR